MIDVKKRQQRSKVRRLLKVFAITIVLSVLALPIAFVMTLYSDTANTPFISAADGTTGPAFDYFVKKLKNTLALIWILCPILFFAISFLRKRSNN